jgi:HEXXH motif-containing protein
MAHETVLVRNAAALGDGAMDFDGGSSFYLWGAVVLNSARLETPAQMAETYAHEAGHAYLLGSTLGAPLVENDPAERYVSPLRADLRPMDGIVHASFVLARMVWCVERMLDQGGVPVSERDVMAGRLALNLRRFRDSQALIEREARFTDTGAGLWFAARDWVAGRAAA